MQKADIKFFEEYKRLDRLCGDMYSCSNGVTEYINRMEKSAGTGISMVKNWNDDYRMLKHVRWVRNQIAHDTEDRLISADSDLQYIEGFYDRIISGDDPLTILRKATDRQRRYHAAGKPHKTRGSDDRKKSGRKVFWFLLLFAVAVAVIVLLVK